MFQEASEVYKLTRKKHDLLFNYYVMRPIAAFAVTIVSKTRVSPNQLTLFNLAMFVVAGSLLVALPTYEGGLIAIGVLEFSYCFDCADGMLARYRKIASKEGHLLDFFTDEMKAVLLAGSLALRMYRTGGLGVDATMWAPGNPWFLVTGVVGVFVIASALSLTNFVRRPEISGQAQSVEAYYETAVQSEPTSLVGKIAKQVMTFLRFLNHYPSHIWLFAALGRLDVFLWVYLALNFLYLGRGWLGLVLRFGKPLPPSTSS
ncbi:MAG: CDP-alcohol phosphatidyltransferase family protein [Polyangiaceae bacterium]